MMVMEVHLNLVRPRRLTCQSGNLTNVNLVRLQPGANRGDLRPGEAPGHQEQGHLPHIECSTGMEPPCDDHNLWDLWRVIPWNLLCEGRGLFSTKISIMPISPICVKWCSQRKLRKNITRWHSKKREKEIKIKKMMIKYKR